MDSKYPVLKNDAYTMTGTFLVVLGVIIICWLLAATVVSDRTENNSSYKTGQNCVILFDYQTEKMSSFLSNGYNIDTTQTNLINKKTEMGKRWVLVRQPLPNNNGRK